MYINLGINKKKTNKRKPIMAEGGELVIPLPNQSDIDVSEAFIGPPTEEMINEAYNISPLPNAPVEQVQPTVVEAPQTQPTHYVIQKGDTLAKIARETGMSIQDIARMNNIKDVNKIYTSATLKLDPSVRIPNGTSNNTVAKKGGTKATSINVAKKENLESDTIATPQLRRNVVKGDAAIISDPFPLKLNNNTSTTEIDPIDAFFNVVQHLGATPENNQHVADLQNTIFGLGLSSVIPTGSIAKGVKQISNSAKNVISKTPKNITKSVNLKPPVGNRNNITKPVVNFERPIQQGRVHNIPGGISYQAPNGRLSQIPLNKSGVKYTPPVRTNRVKTQNGISIEMANGGFIGNIGDEIELTPEQIKYYQSLGYEFE